MGAVFEALSPASGERVADVVGETLTENPRLRESSGRRDERARAPVAALP